MFLKEYVAKITIHFASKSKLTLNMHKYDTYYTMLLQCCQIITYNRYVFVIYLSLQDTHL